MRFKNGVWRYATTIVVVLVLLNPEMAELALFVDAVGLDLFLMLLEIQVVVISGLFFKTKIKPACIQVRQMSSRLLASRAWRAAKDRPSHLGLSVSGPAALMNVLVVSFSIGTVFSAW